MSNVKNQSILTGKLKHAKENFLPGFQFTFLKVGAELAQQNMPAALTGTEDGIIDISYKEILFWKTDT